MKNQISILGLESDTVLLFLVLLILLNEKADTRLLLAILYIML